MDREEIPPKNMLDRHLYYTTNAMDNLVRLQQTRPRPLRTPDAAAAATITSNNNTTTDTTKAGQKRPSSRSPSPPSAPSATPPRQTSKKKKKDSKLDLDLEKDLDALTDPALLQDARSFTQGTSRRPPARRSL